MQIPVTVIACKASMPGLLQHSPRLPHKQLGQALPLLSDMVCSGVALAKWQGKCIVCSIPSRGQTAEAGHWAVLQTPEMTRASGLDPK